MRKFVDVLALGCICSVLAHTNVFAQGWPSWANEAFGRSGYSSPPVWSAPAPSPDVDKPRPPSPAVVERRPMGGGISSGGSRPSIAPKAPPIVSFEHAFPANSIVIDTGGRKLYFVLENNQAYAYSISVGREGFNWSGVEVISRKQSWPDWYPPAEMRERDPSLPEKMTGGLRNPLGAMALYLGKTLYRIHGTNDVMSIGRAASSGCFRMLNSSVLHLASMAAIGTTVSVVPSLPSAPQQVSQASPAAPQPQSQPAGVSQAKTEVPEKASKTSN